MNLADRDVPVLIDARNGPEVTSHNPVSGVIEAEGNHITIGIEAPITVVMYLVPILVNPHIGELIHLEGNLVAVGSRFHLVQMVQKGSVVVQALLTVLTPGFQFRLGDSQTRGVQHLAGGVHEGLVPVDVEVGGLGPLVDFLLEGDGVILFEVGEGHLGEFLTNCFLHRLLLGGLGGGDDGDRKQGGDDGEDAFHFVMWVKGFTDWS